MQIIFCLPRTLLDNCNSLCFVKVGQWQVNEVTGNEKPAQVLRDGGFAVYIHSAPLRAFSRKPTSVFCFYLFICLFVYLSREGLL